MLKRRISQILLDWKKSKQNECLLIKGARQIGKTYIIREFGRQHYENFIEINFEQDKNMIDVFDHNLDVNELIAQISLRRSGVHFIPGETLIFFDEIQSCPNARTSLKFWALDNRFDVIASGSLLGINYKAVSSFPVGYERQIQMFSLDFEEFLWAKGIDENAIRSLWTTFDREHFIDPNLNDVMMQYLREYMVVGGMPEVVNTFLETHNYNDVHSVQMKILDDYLNDIAKYAPASDRVKARNCFLSLPSQLAKENTKFQYGVVEHKGTSRKYGNAIDWLRDANIVNFCYNVSKPDFPLVAYRRIEQFRVYGSDIGLLIAMFGYEMKQAVVTDSLQGPAKGGIYENLVADILSKKNYSLCYYLKEDSSVEIEFLIENDAAVVPIEVKAKNRATASLNSILKKESIKKGIKLVTTCGGIEDKKVTMPLYLAMFL
ncbi:MAG: ATP-binding protein [Spirochaetales bacterium]|nr:ATP-binding protein [Spirochaetales bacterium]